MWNRYRTVPAFDGQPWLLRFDQLRFYPVSADELARIRRDFPLGRFPCGSSRRNCTGPIPGLPAPRGRTSRPSNHQAAAFDAERQRWIDTGQAHFESDDTAAGAPRPAPLPEGCHGVESDITGNLWQVRVQVGQQVQAGGTRRPGIDENGNHRECATGRRRARSARNPAPRCARPVRRGHRSQSRRFDSVNITALNKTRDLGTVQAYDGTHPVIQGPAL